MAGGRDAGSTICRRRSISAAVTPAAPSLVIASAMAMVVGDSTALTVGWLDATDR